ncbi:MAG: glycoside hydrolase family 57 protein [Deltaproteobacteria bacterium]|nr:glycoside hydrolase family 57 protein [Deltaproteobacteria bacterium]
MPSVCFYFQVHQPYRLRRYSFFDIGANHSYFDSDKNGMILQKVAQKCYLPTNRLMLKLIKQYAGAFKIAYSVTGVAIEQMKEHSPETLDSFVELAETGCVEFLGETYYHSLSSLYDETEFREQVAEHGRLMKEHFGQSPQVFRNTELIYSDEIGRLVSGLGYKAIIAEGADDILQWRSPNFVYNVPGQKTKLLLKNYRLSDDIAFRFSNRGWECFPLTADKFAGWVHNVSGGGDTVNLFMDYETFGEHQWASTGIFEFMERLPEFILRHPDWGFATPSEVAERYPSRAELSYHRITSWADVDRDLTAWRGNRMQNSTLQQIYDLGAGLRYHGNTEALAIWRKLLTSDHFYYMCTKWFADGDVHAYFSPYESPYEAFINYVNVLKDFRENLLPKVSASVNRA